MPLHDRSARGLGLGPPFARPQRDCFGRVTLSPAGPCRASARAGPR